MYDIIRIFRVVRCRVNAVLFADIHIQNLNESLRPLLVNDSFEFWQNLLDFEWI